jgi:hypothetical protein
MTRTVQLHQIASARSGDKGADANVGIWADDDRSFELLRDVLSEERVAAHFARLCKGGVTRYDLPNLRALNFILHDSLDGGGAASLRTDAQGKTLAAGLLQMTVEVPDDLPLR